MKEANRSSAGIVPGSPRPSRREAIVLAAATAAVLAPFLTKAFHIDDPLFLWVARQVQEHPGDPLGFDAVWYLTKMPVAAITKNPPLVSYAIALWAAIGGWSEAWVHLLFVIPAVAVVLGTRRLARSLGGDPRVAALATLAAPVFLVSATTVMSDVPMLALWIWALVLWVEGIERQDRRRLLAAAALAGFAALTKYFAISLLPLFVAYGLARRRGVRLWAPPLALSVAMLAAYQAWTASLYGRGLILDAADYAGTFRAGTASGLLSRLAVGLAFAGGCAPIAILIAPVAWRLRAAIALAAVALGLAISVPIPPLAVDFESHLRPAAPPEVTLQWVLFVAAGLAGVALALDELRRAPRDAAAWLLGLWIAGTLVFAAGVNWSVNGRSALPLAPALALLAGRAVSRSGLSPRAWGAPVAISAALALAAAWGDASLANAGRQAALAILRQVEPGTTWFQGHWGFQYYMEEGGGRPIHIQGQVPAPGDRVVLPFNNSNTFELAVESFARESTLEITVRAPVSTMNAARGAGFYSDEWGPLPYSIGRPPPERFGIFRAVPASKRP